MGVGSYLYEDDKDADERKDNGRNADTKEVDYSDDEAYSSPLGS